MKPLFKRIILLALSISMVIPSISVCAQGFSDVPYEFWAYESIRTVSDKKWFNGYPDGTFRPDMQITRAEAMAVFVKFLELPMNPVEASSYTDVDPTKWYAPYIEAGRGLFPTRENRFRPEAPMLREDAVYAIVVALGYAEDVRFADQSILEVFKDKISISEAVKPYMVVALEQKLVSGFPDGTVRAQGPLTRAEFATVLARAAKHGFKQGVDPNLISTSIGAAINQKFVSGVEYEIYAGNGERDTMDSIALRTASFTSPESVAVSDSGVMYIVDSTKIRKIANNYMTTLSITPSYLTPSIIECDGEDVYFVSNEFQDVEGNKYYAIAKYLPNGKAERIFTTEAVYSKVRDVDIYDGVMYILQYNAGVGATYLMTLNLETNEPAVLGEVEGDFSSIAMYDENTLFLANAEKGSIYRMNLTTMETRLYCGVDSDTKIIDGANSRFFEPLRITCSGDYLYVLDYNILRRVRISDSVLAASAESLAGQFTVENFPAPIEAGLGRDAVFPHSYDMDFVVKDDGTIILTDPKNAVVWKIK